MIEQFLFIGTNNVVHVSINEKPLFADMLYLIPKNSRLKIADVEFDHETLTKIYRNQATTDSIYYKNQIGEKKYDFVIHNTKNKFDIFVNKGTIYKNGKKIPKQNNYKLYYDDILQIAGQETFNLLYVINDRREISGEHKKPREFYINHSDDFFSIAREESKKSILHIEIVDSVHIINPTTKKNWHIYLNNLKLTEPTELKLNTDVITINKRNFCVNELFDLVETPFELEQINVLDLKHYFNDGNVGLDSISFDMNKNELIGIMGQSGAGKSSLLKTLSGEVFATYGKILYDGKNFYENINFYTQFVGYVPQDDLLFSHLTVYENLYYRGKLRIPKITSELLEHKINSILLKTGLSHRKNTMVGDLKNKKLSGGERKRLNLALELLFDPTVLICDEPTSGLSYLDAEQVINILADYAKQGRIVAITIHQPSSYIFHKFSKVLLVDKGGKQVYFGSPNDVFNYFNTEYEQVTINKDVITEKKKNKLPEYVNIMIEYPEYRENGETVYEKVGQNILIKRRFSPDYWRDKYKRKMLFEMIQYDENADKTAKTPTSKRNKVMKLSGVRQFYSFFRRNLTMKYRNIMNLIVTFGGAPLLGLLISFILRLAAGDTGYSYYKNINIGIYIFISIIVFIFLGMSNSIEEILSERKIIIREKMLNLRVSYFLGAKILVLSLFSLIQIFLYLFVSQKILGFSGLFMIYSVYLFAAAHIGNSVGLFFSSILVDSKSSVNILPLVLIPQIIFGGAIVEFEKMNLNLRLEKTNPIPEIVYSMPSYYLFEGMYTATAKLNPHDRRIAELNRRRRALPSGSPVSALNDIYEEINTVNTRFPKLEFTNEYVNLSVNMMDGRMLNTKRNVFLSSQKQIWKWKFPTYFFNLLIVLLIALLINFVSYMRLKIWFWK
jgi:ABC-type multidrug transport system ATPase subunit